MGQAAAKKDPIPELSDVTLKGVVALNVELGREHTVACSL